MFVSTNDILIYKKYNRQFPKETWVCEVRSELLIKNRLVSIKLIRN